VRELKLFELDERAVAYLRQRVDHLRGYAPSLAVAPHDVPIEHLYEFEAGGLLPENLDFSRATKLEDGSTMMPVSSLQEQQRDELSSVLRRDPGLVCLAVDPLPRKGDPALELWPTTFLVGDEVYQLFMSKTSDEDFELALFAAPFWCDLQIISRAPPKVDVNRNSTSAELRKCASAAIEVWCSAYDGEGFLRWRGG
jgi:hypothetical protein